MEKKTKKYHLINKIGDWSYYQISWDGTNELQEDYSSEYYLSKEIFDICPFKDIIFKKYNIMAIVINGSYITGCCDNHSDYDLQVFVDGELELIDTYKWGYECLFYKGHKLHWYYYSNNMNLNVYKSGLALISRVWVNYLKPEHFVYINPKYEWLKNNLLAYKNDIVKYGIGATYYMFYDRINKIVKQNKILPEDYSKYLGSWFLSSYILNNDLAKLNLDNMLYLKRLRVREYNKFYLEEATKRLKILVEYFNTYPSNFEEYFELNILTWSRLWEEPKDVIANNSSN